MKENAGFFYFLIETGFHDTRSYFLPSNQNARLTIHNQSKFMWCHSRVSILSSKHSSVLEYACQAFHTNLPAYLSDQIERVQKRFLRILFPEFSYSKALEDAGLKTLFHRREELCSSLFKQIVQSDQQYTLAGLLPAYNDSEKYNFRTRRMFSISNVKTKGFRNTFIMHFAIKQQL